MKKDRLANEQDFAKVFSRANKSADKLLTVLASENDFSQARLGFALAKKSVKKAVQRNKIRRIIRESFRLNKQQLLGFDFVVMCTRHAANANKKALAISIKKHWKKLAANE